MRILQGDRIAKGARLMPGTAAIIFDQQRAKILLTRRADNGRWCLPGARLESGESATEGCIREVLEETCLHVRIVKLIGIYTSPDFVLQYDDGNRVQPIAFCFEAAITAGEIGLSDETTEFGWFTAAQIASMDLVEHHRQRIVDAFANHRESLVR